MVGVVRANSSERASLSGEKEIKGGSQDTENSGDSQIPERGFDQFKVVDSDP